MKCGSGMTTYVIGSNREAPPDWHSGSEQHNLQDGGKRTRNHRRRQPSGSFSGQASAGDLYRINVPLPADGFYRVDRTIFD